MAPAQSLRPRAQVTQVPEGASPPPVSPQARRVSEAALRWESCKFKSQSPRAEPPAQGTAKEVAETGGGEPG